MGKHYPVLGTGAMMLVIIGVFLTPWLAASEPAPHLFDKTVRLDVWGGRLSDVTDEVRRQSGVAFLLHREDFSDATLTAPINLISGQVTLRTIAEGLARYLDCRYRIAGPDTVEFFTSYGWAATRPYLRFIQVPSEVTAHLAADEPDPFLDQVKELTKAASLLEDGYRVAVEVSPRSDASRAVKVVSSLPATLSSYLTLALSCLAGDMIDGVSLGAVTGFVQAWRPDRDLRRRLEVPVILSGTGHIRQTLREMGDQAGIAIIITSGYHSEEARSGGTGRIQRSVGRAVEELAYIHSLGKRVFLAGGRAVIFEPGEAGEVEVDAGVRESYWSGLTVAGFSVDTALRWKSAKDIAAAIRDEIYPEVWQDPVCGMVVEPSSQRLVVIAPSNVIAAIREWLHQLAR